MRPIYTCFFTPGLYEQEAARNIARMDALGLEHDCRKVGDHGSWQLNTHQTPRHLAAMMDAYPDRPIVYLDADAYIHCYPDLFDRMPGDVDIAVHYRRGEELLNGTLYIAPTDAARKVIDKYLSDVVRHRPMNEQKCLQDAIAATPCVVQRLPATYAWIHDIMAADVQPHEQIVIEHLQASRERHGNDARDRRRNRIAQIGATA